MKSSCQKYIIIFTIFIANSATKASSPGTPTRQLGVIIASKNSSLQPAINRDASTPRQEEFLVNPSEVDHSELALTTAQQDSQELRNLMKDFQKRKIIATDSAQEITESKLYDAVHVKITREQLRIIEFTCLALGAFGITKLFHAQSSEININRSLPTDMVGAAFWSFGKVSSLASSGVTLVSAAFAFHKVKGWVDAIYASDTDRKIKEQLRPIQAELEKINLNTEKLAQYVDQTTQPIAQAHNSLSQKTIRLAQEQKKLTTFMKKTAEILEKMTQENKKQKPTDQSSVQLAQEVIALNQGAVQAQEESKNLTNAFKQEPSPLARPNPITTKEKSSRCCGCK